MIKKKSPCLLLSLLLGTALFMSCSNTASSTDNSDSGTSTSGTSTTTDSTTVYGSATLSDETNGDAEFELIISTDSIAESADTDAYTDFSDIVSADDTVPITAYGLYNNVGVCFIGFYTPATGAFICEGQSTLNDSSITVNFSGYLDSTDYFSSNSTLTIQIGDNKYTSTALTHDTNGSVSTDIADIDDDDWADAAFMTQAFSNESYDCDCWYTHSSPQFRGVSVSSGSEMTIDDSEISLNGETYSIAKVYDPYVDVYDEDEVHYSQIKQYVVLKITAVSESNSDDDIGKYFIARVRIKYYANGSDTGVSGHIDSFTETSGTYDYDTSCCVPTLYSSLSNAKTAKEGTIYQGEKLHFSLSVD